MHAVTVGQAHVDLAGAAAMAPHVVHLWSAWVDQVSGQNSQLEVLDPLERARADRHRSDRARARYVARHAFYRRVLAACLGIEPRAVPIRTGAQGRPELAWPDAPDFNTSHADGLAVIAVSHGRRVGVDIERDRDLDDAPDLAEACLTVRELEAFRATPSASRSRAFLALWTRKEAVVKAAGGGLSIPLDGFDTGPIDTPVAREVVGLPGGRSFVLASIDWFPGWHGSIALEGAGIQVLPRPGRPVVA
jgi:4'-phosphopantetheinyl transferase